MREEETGKSEGGRKRERKEGGKVKKGRKWGGRERKELTIVFNFCMVINV